MITSNLLSLPSASGWTWTEFSSENRKELEARKISLEKRIPCIDCPTFSEITENDGKFSFTLSRY